MHNLFGAISHIKDNPLSDHDLIKIKNILIIKNKDITNFRTTWGNFTSFGYKGMSSIYNNNKGIIDKLYGIVDGNLRRKINLKGDEKSMLDYLNNPNPTLDGYSEIIKNFIGVLTGQQDGSEDINNPLTNQSIYTIQYFLFMLCYIYRLRYKIITESNRVIGKIGTDGCTRSTAGVFKDIYYLREYKNIITKNELENLYKKINTILTNINSCINRNDVCGSVFNN